MIPCIWQYFSSDCKMLVWFGSEAASYYAALAGNEFSTFATQAGWELAELSESWQTNDREK